MRPLDDERGGSSCTLGCSTNAKIIPLHGEPRGNYFQFIDSVKASFVLLVICLINVRDFLFHPVKDLSIFAQFPYGGRVTPI